jgi:hypothetical protein
MPSKYVLVSGVLFGVIAVVQAVRALNQWPVHVGGFDVPVWVSWVAMNRVEITALIDQQAVRAEPNEVHLRREALSQWDVTHVPLTSELLEEKLSADKNRSYDNPYVYVHDRDIDWLCRYTLMVPIYIRRNPATRQFNERQYLSFVDGDCYQLIAPQKKFVAYRGA